MSAMLETLAPAPQADDTAAIVLEQTDRLLAQHVTPACLTAADAGTWAADAWAALEQAGLPLALVPEEAGGVGLSPAVAAQVMRRTGYHALPVPLPETMIANALWVEAGGDPIEGPTTLAPDCGSARLTRSGSGWVLSGTLPRVPWGAAAQHVLLTAAGDLGEGHLVLLPHGAHAVRTRRNLANEPRDSLDLSGVVLADQQVRPLPSSVAAAGEDGLMLFGAYIRAQQMAGAMERCLDFALAYANERKQFGRPIGRFQAIQHMLAEAAGHSAAAGAAAQVAARAYGGPHFPFAAAIAKARAGEAAGRVAEICHQVHGAMGFTHEHPLHFFTRRLWAWRDEYGREAHWQAKIGNAVCAAGGEALWPMLVAMRAGTAQG
ncbi:MAG TPA: acyl-CoA dehydrogenase family protein [Xanthobacteraceae bacterium]